jgi:hypothetical protein
VAPGEEIMATGAVAGALMAVQSRHGEESVIQDVDVEMVEGLATNVLNVRLFGAPFRLTVEREEAT